MAGAGKITDDILMVEICQKFSWTTQEYLSQPQWFIDMIVERLAWESEEHKRAEAKSKFGN